jgi:hypothetical protein
VTSPPSFPPIPSDTSVPTSSVGNTVTPHASPTSSPSPTALYSPSSSPSPGAVVHVDSFVTDAILWPDDEALQQWMWTNDGANGSSSPRTMLASAALPARRGRVQLGGRGAITGMTADVSLSCEGSGDILSQHTWTAPISPASTIDVWLWQPAPYESDSGQTSPSHYTCNVTVALGDTPIPGLVQLSITQLAVRWAEIGDILTVIQDTSSVSDSETTTSIIRSMRGGKLNAHDVWLSLCCPSSTTPNCTTDTCTVSNATTSETVLTAAATAFAKRLNTSSTRPPTSGTITAAGNMTITLVSEVFMRHGGLIDGVGPYGNDTRVYAGNVLCTIVWVGVNGHLITIILPTLTSMCGDSTTSIDCGYRDLRVEVPSSLLKGDDTPLGTTVQCPPVCPGVQPPGVLIAPVVTSNAVILTHAIASESNGFLTPLQTSDTSSLGLYFTTSCTASGFPSLSVDTCTNTSDPDFHRCPFGAGANCRVCPSGAMCPGGFRAWPQPGFFAVSESVGSVMQCPAPSSRCASWDVPTGKVECGPGYRDNSYLCTSCAPGFYVDDDGTCVGCPVNSDTSGAILQVVIFISGLLGGVGLLYALCLALFKLLKGPTTNMAGSFLNLLTWTFATLQLVGQLGKAASAGLPAQVRTMYSALLVFQFEGATIPATCTGQNPLQGQIIACIVVSTVVIFLYCGYAIAWFNPACAAKLQGRKAVKLAVKATILALSVSYAPVFNGLLQVVVCTPTMIPVRTYLELIQDGTAMQAAGVVLPSNPTRAQLDVLLQVPLLMSDPSQVCYEALHSTAFPLAWLTAALYIIAYPIAVVTYTMCRTRRGGLAKDDSVIVVHNKAATSSAFPTAVCAAPAAVATLCLGTEEICRPVCGCVPTPAAVEYIPPRELLSKAIERDADLQKDALILPFINAQYSPYYIWFMLVDATLQCGLATIGFLWRYPNKGASNATKTALLCTMFAAAAWVYETRQPFRVGRSWKSHVKSLSFILCALGAVVNALLIEDEATAPTATGGAVTSRVTACSFILIAGTVVLVVLLFVAFLASLFAEQKLNVLLRTARLTLLSRLSKTKPAGNGMGNTVDNAIVVDTVGAPTMPVRSSRAMLYSGEGLNEELEDDSSVRMLANPMGRAIPGSTRAMDVVQRKARSSLADFVPTTVRSNTNRRSIR